MKNILKCILLVIFFNNNLLKDTEVIPSVFIFSNKKNKKSQKNLNKYQLKNKKQLKKNYSKKKINNKKIKKTKKEFQQSEQYQNKLEEYKKTNEENELQKTNDTFTELKNKEEVQSEQYQNKLEKHKKTNEENELQKTNETFTELKNKEEVQLNKKLINKLKKKLIKEKMKEIQKLRLKIPSIKTIIEVTKKEIDDLILKIPENIQNEIPLDKIKESIIKGELLNLKSIFLIYIRNKNDNLKSFITSLFLYNIKISIYNKKIKIKEKLDKEQKFEESQNKKAGILEQNIGNNTIKSTKEATTKIVKEINQEIKAIPEFIQEKLPLNQIQELIKEEKPIEKYLILPFHPDKLHILKKNIPSDIIIPTEVLKDIFIKLTEYNENLNKLNRNNTNNTNKKLKNNETELKPLPIKSENNIQSNKSSGDISGINSLLSEVGINHEFESNNENIKEYPKNIPLLKFNSIENITKKIQMRAKFLKLLEELDQEQKFEGSQNKINNNTIK